MFMTGVLCTVCGAQVYFLHFTFAYHINKAPYNKSCGPVSVFVFWQLLLYYDEKIRYIAVWEKRISSSDIYQ